MPLARALSQKGLPVAIWGSIFCKVIEVTEPFCSFSRTWKDRLSASALGRGKWMCLHSLASQSELTSYHLAVAISSHTVGLGKRPEHFDASLFLVWWHPRLRSQSLFATGNLTGRRYMHPMRREIGCHSAFLNWLLAIELIKSNQFL